MIDRSLNYGRDCVRAFLQRIAPYQRVLDVGAGRGADLLTAREVCPEAQLYGVEVHPPAAAALEAHGVATHAIDIERDPLPFDAEAIDVVIANQILEHTKEVFWILHEISRVLPVGGTLILGIPNLASLHNRLLLAIGRQPTPIHTCSAHVRGFTKHDLLRFVRTCFPGGYALRGFRGSNFYPFPAFLARALARLFPGLAWGIFLQLEKRRPYERSFLELPVARELETNFWLGPPELRPQDPRTRARKA